MFWGTLWLTIKIFDIVYFTTLYYMIWSPTVLYRILLAFIVLKHLAFRGLGASGSRRCRVNVQSFLLLKAAGQKPWDLRFTDWFSGSQPKARNTKPRFMPKPCSGLIGEVINRSSPKKLRGKWEAGHTANAVRHSFTHALTHAPTQSRTHYNASSLYSKS